MNFRWVLMVAVLYTGLALAGCTFIAAYPVTSISLGTLGATGKSPVDHAASGVTDQDCQWLRIFDWQPICQDKPAKPTVSEGTPTQIESKR